MTTATVKIWGKDVGAVSWLNKQGYGVFEYAPSFLATGLELSPIHLSLNDGRAGTIFSFPGLDKITFSGLPGLLASSLPDDFGNKVIDSWLAREGRDPKSFNPVERLCYIGSRGMGALEYIPENSPKNLRNSAAVEVEKLMELAQNVLCQRTHLAAHVSGDNQKKAEAMLDILRVGVSAGGAVPKAVIAMNKEGHVLSGQSTIPEGYDHWLLKFDGIYGDMPDRFGKSNDSCRIEYAYYLMAAAAGINMTKSRLLEENGRAHFLTARFDRNHNEKIHTQTLASIGHFAWNPPGTVGYESVFQVMRMLQLPYPEQEQLFRRMVFNAITRNVDDHVKNQSFMMDTSGEWKLTPAYDLTFSVNSEDPLGETHKMTINGKQDRFSYDDFTQVAYNMEVNKPEAIIDEVINVCSKWDEYAKEAGVSSEVRKHIGSQLLNEQSLECGLNIT